MRYIRSLKFVNSIASKKKVTSSLPPITFTDEDFKGIDRCHNDPMVVKIEVTNFLVCNVLLNNRSSVGVLYWSALKQLGIPESQIKPLPKQVIGFVGETTDTIGYVHLLTTFRDERGSKSIMIANEVRGHYFDRTSFTQQVRGHYFDSPFGNEVRK